MNKGLKNEQMAQLYGLRQDELTAEHLYRLMKENKVAYEDISEINTTKMMRSKARRAAPKQEKRNVRKSKPRKRSKRKSEQYEESDDMESYQEYEEEEEEEDAGEVSESEGYEEDED